MTQKDNSRRCSIDTHRGTEAQWHRATEALLHRARVRGPHWTLLHRHTQRHRGTEAQSHRARVRGPTANQVWAWPVAVATEPPALPLGHANHGRGLIHPQEDAEPPATSELVPCLEGRQPTEDKPDDPAGFPAPACSLKEGLHVLQKGAS